MLIGTLKRFLGVACVGVLLPLQAQAPASVPTAATAPAAVPAPAPKSQLSMLLAKAKAVVGSPYRHGGITPKGFDCSGFVHFVFSSIGIDLNRSSGDQARQGAPVDLNHLLPGDLLFFSTRGVRKGISHVAIYLGDGRFVHASNWGGPGKRCVRFGELATDYFADRLVSARRILKPLAPMAPMEPMAEDDKTP